MLQAMAVEEEVGVVEQVAFEMEEGIRELVESTVLNPERMVKTSYKQLAYDMGMPVVNKAMEHQMGLIELYEYLKGAAFIGPWGSVENPVLVPAVRYLIL